MSPEQARRVADPPPDDELRRLLQRAEGGDAEALPALRRFLDERPGLWKEAGDLALQAERAWAALAAGPNRVVAEAIHRRLDALRAELAGPPSPVDRLLVERVVLTWLEATYADAVSAQNAGRSLPPAQADYLQRRQERVQRRHLEAVKALAQVRGLLARAGGGAAPGGGAGGRGGAGRGGPESPEPGARARGRRRPHVPPAIRDRFQSVADAAN
jgi:hypothetical protein